MSETTVDMQEVLIVTPTEMLKQIAESVAEAQCQLDAAALSRQKSLGDKYSDLVKIGYQPSWLTMSEVSVELKMVVHYVENKLEPSKSGFFFGLFNASYKNTLQYEAEGASTLKVRIVPIPPPVMTSTSSPG